jgi:glycosyltransferase involved in cell wall biosynthesis
MKAALLTTDSREHYREYGKPIPYFGSAPEALLQGFALLPEIEVHVISCARESMRSPAQVASNIFFHSLHVPKLGWMRTAYQGCIRAVRRKLRQIQPNLVHGQGTERDCALSAISSGYPNLVTIHGNMRLIAQLNKARPFSFLWLAARLERFTIPRTDGVVCITEYTRQAVAPLARKTWVVPNAVDASFFEIRPQPPPHAPARILCVGLICPRKNQNAFIRALDPLSAKRPIELLFLGQAQPGQAYDDEFLELVRGRPWCRHGGFADREELKRQLQQTAVVALPSLEDNCPMVVLEAMAAGVPVAAARVGGVPDLVEEGRSGFLFDPLDPNSMRAAVEKVLADSATALGIAAQARRIAQERFHPRIIARRHLDIYNEVLGKRT